MDTLNKDAKIVIVSGTGFSNYGDEAILAANISRLRENNKNRCNPYPLAILSPDVRLTQKFHRLKEGEEIITRPRVSSLAKLILLLRKKNTELEKLVAESAYILNTGGGHLNSYDKDELYFRLYLYYLAYRYDKDICFGAQTIGPLKVLDDYLLTYILNKIDSKRLLTIPLRDRFISTGLESILSKDVLTLDDAYDLAPSLSGLRFIRNNRIKIGINIKGSTDLYGGNEKSAFTLIESICKEILEQGKKNVVLYLIPTADNDIPLLRELEYKLDHVRVIRVRGIYLPREVKGVVSSMDANIGMRYHFGVFSVSSDIPFLGIASGEYQHTKLSGLIRDEAGDRSDTEATEIVCTSTDYPDLVAISKFLGEFVK